MTVKDLRDIQKAYAELRDEAPNIRARDAASRLGVTEAALVASDVTGPALALRPEWQSLIRRLPELGPVMALTRNENAVHERHGRYEDVSSGPGHILVLGPDIDLRLFPGNWAHAYAVGGARPSIQIFDRDGVAAHKIYAVKDRTLMDQWFDLIVGMIDPDPAQPPLSVVPQATPAFESNVNAETLRADWLALQDTHDFFPMLRRHKASRRQAFALAGADLAQAIDADGAVACLTEAAEAEIPIMIFVGNRTAIQIHTGPVRRLAASPGGWFNVLDPEFNLHLRTTGIAQAWRVVKPTADGPVTSIELLDADGEMIAQFFGARKPGLPERSDWRNLVADIALRFRQQARAA